jgi:sec-independent protein translocase protein TatA
MGSFSAIHWVMVLGVVLLLFGAGKVPALMGDFAKGIKAFRSGMKDDDAANVPAPPQITPPAIAASATEVSRIGSR